MFAVQMYYLKRAICYLLYCFLFSRELTWIYIKKGNIFMSNFKPNNKRKKDSQVELMGSIDFVNSNTGELVTMDVVKKSSKDKDDDFQKIWIYELVSKLELLGSKRLKVAGYLLSKKNNDNLIFGTIRSLAKEIGVSTTTVSETLSILLEADFLTRHKSLQSVYVINPNIICYGSKQRRLNLLTIYTGKDDVEDSAPKVSERTKQSLMAEVKKIKKAQEKAAEESKQNSAHSGQTEKGKQDKDSENDPLPNQVTFDSKVSGLNE